MGVFANPAVDVEAMMEWKDGVVTRLTKGVESLCKNAGVELIDGVATFTGENEARVAHSGEGQGSETIAFEHAIVATGSRPVTVLVFEFDGEHILSSRDAPRAGIGAREPPRRRRGLHRDGALDGVPEAGL